MSEEAKATAVTASHRISPSSLRQAHCSAVDGVMHVSLPVALH